jgi:putative integral membrane protein (TIGR02587 family)
MDSILGKIIIQTLPLNIGASVANAVFGRGGGDAENTGGSSDTTQHGGEQAYAQAKKSNAWRATLADLGTTIGGAIFLSFSVAPTEEIPMLAAELDYWHELALIALTLALTYIIVFESGFSRQHGQGAESDSPFQHPITETVLSYLVALLMALIALFLFDQAKLTDPISATVSKMLVLGLPAAIGGAAGRVLIQGQGPQGGDST